jgi:glutamate dehydrogenase (NAD(P)+)
MAWFMDTYSQQVGHPVPEVVTGKPVVLGGTVGRRAATGLGAVVCIEAALERLGRSLAGMRVVVQGLGNVGAVVAREVAARGARVVGVSDVTCGLVSPAGLDVAGVLAWVGEHRFLRGCPHGEQVGRREVLEVSCDILVPAALEQQITEENAERLDCWLVAEAANGPTTPEAEEILARRGIQVLPDVLVNAGGVTVSYFEWVQDQQKYFWAEGEVAERQERLLRQAFSRMVQASERWQVSWRTAALSVAIERVAEALRLRAIYP